MADFVRGTCQCLEVECVHVCSEGVGFGASIILDWRTALDTLAVAVLQILLQPKSPNSK
jgi:hypothetical protein